MLTSVWTPTNLRIDHTVSLLTNCLSKLSFSSFRLPFSAFDNWKKYSQTCIKRSPLVQRKKWSYKTGDLLKEVQFKWTFLWQVKKRWPFNTGDCLIEVTAWEGLTVNHAQTRFYGKSQNNFNQKYNVIIDTTIVWPMNINNSLLVKSLVWFSLWCLMMPLSTIFQLYRGSQFIGEGNRRKPPTCRKSLTLYNIMLYQVHLGWAVFKLTTLVAICTDCIGSYKSNYHRITTMMAPYLRGLFISV
jgi:hypothetical protein